MKYGKYSFGQAEAIFNMIGGEAAVDAVLVGKKKIVLEDVAGTVFTATVVYAIPAMDELKRRFPAFVDQAYNSIIFEPSKVCKNVSRETREVEFEYVHLDRIASNIAVLAEIDKRGLRPALPEELLGFAEKYPDEQFKYPILALGSEAVVEGARSFASLYGSGAGRILNLSQLSDGWRDRCRFLCVRKEEELAP